MDADVATARADESLKGSAARRVEHLLRVAEEDHRREAREVRVGELILVFRVFDGEPCLGAERTDLARGGTIRGAEIYEHDATTFTEQAKKLVTGLVGHPLIALRYSG